VTVGSLDLLIASVAVHHDAELITFDADFEQIATVATLRVTRLMRPV
jgi:predicted nucleic acid-binding protein